MTVKFVTVKGSENLGRSPFYVGLVQHERTEAYEYLAERSRGTAWAGGARRAAAFG